MLNTCYNQVTPSIKISDLCELVTSGRLEELRHTLSTLSTDALDYIETILDEYRSYTSPWASDEDALAAWEADNAEYGQIRSIALEILATRR
jgi:hypothetical protein